MAHIEYKLSSRGSPTVSVIEKNFQVSDAKSVSCLVLALKDLRKESDIILSRFVKEGSNALRGDTTIESDDIICQGSDEDSQSEEDEDEDEDEDDNSEPISKRKKEE